MPESEVRPPKKYETPPHAKPAATAATLDTKSDVSSKDGLRRTIKTSRYDSSLATERILRRKRRRALFLNWIYLEVLCEECAFWAFAVAMDLALGKRLSAHQPFRQEANERYAQYVVFLLFYIVASVTVFKARRKHRGGLATVDLLLFGLSFALGCLLVVFVYYPCSEDDPGEDPWDAFVACVTLTLLNFCVTSAFVVFRRIGPPGPFYWSLITLAVAGVDAGLYFLVYLTPEWGYFSPRHFLLGAFGASLCHLALIIISRTVMRRQTKRLLRDDTRKVMGRQEPYIFATFHTFLCFMFLQLSFAMALHYHRIFFAWYERRQYSLTDSAGCD